MALTQIKTDLIANSAVTQSKIDPNVELGGAAVTTSATAPTSPTPSTGDLWYNTTTGKLSVYYNAGWVVTQLDQQGIGSRVVDVFTATASQTVFTTSAGYSVGYVDVYVNGIKLLPADFTATNATTVTLGSGADLNDEVVIISWTLAPGVVSFVSDIFTGNGTQTVYTLSVTPSNEKQTTVVIDGVSQIRNTYSVSGAALTFSEAPGNGAVIEVTTAKGSAFLTTSYNDLTDKPDLTGLGIKISNIQVTDSGGTVLDDTAVDIAGGYIKLTGSGFLTGCQVLINNIPATSTTFVSSTVVRAQVPATAAGTYIVYLVNPDGGVGIRVNGVTFSATPSWVTGSSLEGNVDTALSLQLSATGASTFALQSGSTLPTGLTLSSGGLISGTVTGLTQETVYSFTVIATDAENQDSPRTFSITITVGDQYFNRTVLAINGDVNTFVSDASTNNFPITVAGDTRPSNFSPYNTNWSNEFDGTGDSLQITGSAALSSTGDFTIEGWGYFRSISNYTGIFSMRNATNAAGASINILNTGNFDFSVSPGGEYTATAVPLNRWFHVALVRSGSSTNNVSCYLDGVRVAQFTSNSQANGGSNVAIIGRYYVDGTDQYHANGFISNVRYVNGTALYSGATITVPTSPLTAVTNTAILTCQSNRFIDNSTNAFTIQRNGDTKVSAFGPFTETDTTTGSGYFDGTGDRLAIASNDAFRTDQGDWTISCWVYVNSVSGYQSLISRGVYSSTYGYLLSTNGSSLYFEAGNGAWATTAIYTSPVNAIRAGQWNHVAAVRSGSTFSMYANGTRVFEQTSASFGANVANTIYIGSYLDQTSSPLTGYLSNFTFNKGTALYTGATYTIPSAPLTAVANTSLLTLQNRQPVNNHSFIDASRNNLLVTKTGNPIQGSFSPFSPAGWSGYFDGTGDSLQIGTTNAPLSWLNTAGAVGTIEAWIYPTAFRAGSGTNTHPAILGIGATYLNFGLANGIPRFYWWTGSVNSLDAGSAVALNAWTHIALVFNGSGANNLKMYVNGTIAATGTFTNIAWASASGGDNVYIGAESSNASSIWLGYISNLRIVNGTALYTENFTPPESALTAIANTTVLTCQSNRFRDNSTNNYTITRNGDTAVVNFSPFRPTAAYSPITHGGSAYFDGSGDYTTATGTALNLGSNNFTVEGWYYFNNGAENAVRIMAANYNTWSAGGMYYGKHSNNSGVVTVWVYNHSTSGPLLVDPTLPPTKEWVHYAVVRSGNTWTLYRNGVSVSTGTTSASLSTTNAIYNVGGSPESATYTHNGYISGFKVTNGTALYTSNFSVPTSPTTASNNTSLLLNYNNAGIVDVSSRHVMETVGDAKIVTSTRKYGTGSMYFDGTGDYLASYSDLTKLNCTFGTGNFTIEMWINFATVGTNLGMVDVWSGTTGAPAGPWYLYRLSTNVIGFGIHGAGPIVSSTTNTAASTWYHVAVTRSGTSLRLFVNGVLESSATNSSDLVASGLQLGLVSTPYLMNGYIDDFRITKGFARYTANFTPPTGTFLVR